MSEQGLGYVYLWEYRVSASNRDAFEKAYGPGGDWVQLFRRAEGYLGTQLVRDRTDPTRYVTVDAWESEASWRLFRDSYASEFESLDAKCEELTDDEREVGRFDVVHD